MVQSHEVIDADHHGLHDEDEDESLFAVYSEDDIHPSCLVDHHCIRKRNPPLKAEVETVGASYARILQYKRLGIHFKAAQKPKPKPKPKPRRNNRKKNNKKPSQVKSRNLKKGRDWRLDKTKNQHAWWNVKKYSAQNRHHAKPNKPTKHNNSLQDRLKNAQKHKEAKHKSPNRASAKNKNTRAHSRPQHDFGQDFIHQISHKKNQNGHKPVAKSHKRPNNNKKTVQHGQKDKKLHSAKPQHEYGLHSFEEIVHKARKPGRAQSKKPQKGQNHQKAQSKPKKPVKKNHVKPKLKAQPRKSKAQKRKTNNRIQSYHG